MQPKSKNCDPYYSKEYKWYIDKVQLEVVISKGLSEILSPTRILYHFRIVQNKYSIIGNCYDYFNSRIFLKLNISPSYFCAVHPFLIERYLFFTLSDENFNQLVTISHPGQFERATNNSKYLYWLIYSIRFYFATVCHLIWVKI